jgi:hypothetical protein
MIHLRWLFLIGTFLPHTLYGEMTPQTLRLERDKLMERGMWREAVEFYQEKLMPLAVGETGVDLSKAVEALDQLRAWKEFDGMVDGAVAAHPADSQLLTAAAEMYFGAQHGGRIVAGEHHFSGSGAGTATGAAGDGKCPR